MKSTLFSMTVLVLTFVVALAFVAGNVSAWGGKKVDIKGKVEQGKFVADNGQTYSFASNAKSQELTSKHMCHEMEVKGTVTKKNGEDTIRVSSFKHIAEGTC